MGKEERQKEVQIGALAFCTVSWEFYVPHPPSRCEVVGFRRGWTEFFRLLGYHAAWDGLKPTFRDYLSVQFSNVKMSKKDILTSVLNHLTPRNNSEDGIIHLYVYSVLIKIVTGQLELISAACGWIHNLTDLKYLQDLSLSLSLSEVI